jgi:hypothetical protein
VTDEEMELPDDTVFVYVKGSVGNMCHNGYNHYLGCSKTTEEYKGGNGCTVENCFPGITFFQFDNIIFEDEVRIVTPEEFYATFHLDEFYIFKYTNEDCIVKQDGSYETFPSRLISISKIIEARSPYLIKTLQCTVSSWIPVNTQEVLGITVQDNVELKNLCPSVFNQFETVVIKKDCDKEFTECINKVLNKVNKSL